MKKLSNKKRKLQYIREKNFLRKGGVARDYFKIAVEILGDEDFLMDMIQEHSRYSLKKLGRTFKSEFALSEIIIGYDDEDFIRDLRTVMIKTKCKIHQTEPVKYNLSC